MHRSGGNAKDIFVGKAEWKILRKYPLYGNIKLKMIIRECNLRP